MIKNRKERIYLYERECEAARKSRKRKEIYENVRESEKKVESKEKILKDDFNKWMRERKKGRDDQSKKQLLLADQGMNSHLNSMTLQWHTKSEWKK